MASGNEATMSHTLHPCPGCGTLLPVTGISPCDRFHASGECYNLYISLMGYTMSLGDAEFAHQYAVDAYAAQHPGPPGKPISTVFALIGLYLALERGYTGRQVQLVHMQIARQPWPYLPPPATPGNITVAHLLDTPEADRPAKLRSWMQSVWSSWAEQQAWIREQAQPYLLFS